MISDFEIAKSLLAKLKTVPGIPAISIDGEKFVPTVGTPYIREFVLRGRNSHLGLANNSKEIQESIYQIDVLTPKGEGKWRNLKICKDIKTVFSYGLKIPCDGHKLMVLNCAVGPSRDERDFFVTSNSFDFIVVD